MLTSFLTVIDRYINRFIGLSGLSPPLQAQIRAQQIESIQRLTPSMMIGSTVVAVMVTGQYLGEDILPFVLAWAAAIGIMVLMALQSWLQSLRTGRRLRASQRTIWHAVLNAALLGLLWGLLPVITMFGDPEAPQRIMIAIIIVGIICGGTLALSAVPMAAIAFTLPVFAGSMAALLQSLTVADQFIAILLVTYSSILVAASLSSARVFVGRLVANAESGERGAVIAMLLKEFEENASDWLWSTDAGNSLERISERFSTASGRSSSNLSGSAFLDLFVNSGAEEHSAFAQIIEHLQAREAFRDVELPVMREGERRWWKLSAQPFYDESGVFTGYRGVGSDITEHKNAEDRVTYLAHFDDLTGLANRANFARQLGEAISQLERHEIGFALLMIDLDQFKAVNDTRGHATGDQLLVQVSRRFASIVGKNDFVARLSGDEFAVIQPNPPNREATAELAQSLIEAAREPIDIAGLPVSIGASIGITTAPLHGSRADQLMRNADLALYRAKQGGRNAFRFFQVKMDRRAQERRVLERQISQALAQNQFELKYQPLIDVESNQVAGFEALVRWNHPDRGTVSPDIFVPVAEDTGAIKAIGDWVLREACRTAAAWPDDLTISVNLSARQFENQLIVESVAEALQLSSLDPKKLELEITESVLIDHPEDTIEMLNQLRATGVSIAIDDFGTGYSSLSYLWKFPFDKIKLDQSFVAAIETDKVACDILKIIGSLGQTLNMRITAEGVETVEQAKFLRSIACHQLQGFYFSKPIAAGDLAAFLAENLTGRLHPGKARVKRVRKAASDA